MVLFTKDTVLPPQSLEDVSDSHMKLGVKLRLCMHGCVYMGVRTCVGGCTCVRASVCVCVHGCVYAWVCVHVCVHRCVYM